MKQLYIFLFFCICQCLPAQPKFEIRAVWLTVNYGLDWPERPFYNSSDIKSQKDELDRILDHLQDMHINLVFFQTRVRGDVIYPSQIEPRSDYIKSDYATADYDPLSYAIEACRQRGMECHAWFVVYPLGSESVNKKLNRNYASMKREKIVKSFKKSLYLDPGNPQTDVYLISIIREIVSNYDIDGIHFDYIRYPDASAAFPDTDTYRQYGNGQRKDDWRRENINRFVYAAYDEIKSLKPWVQVSSSVVGMYKELPETDRRHWTAYNSVYQDPVDWIEKGKHDFIVPMNYYSGTLFYPFVEDWVSRSSERFIVSGLGAYMMDPREGNWDSSILSEQIHFSRNVEIHGNAFFRAKHLLDHTTGFGRELRSDFYSTPALLPPLTWLNPTIPNAPPAVSAHSDGSFLSLSWDNTPENGQQAIFYNLYRSETYPVDTLLPENLLATRLANSHFKLPIDNQIESGYYYVVTGYDRYRNESVCSKPAYFVTGNFEK